jgi:N-acetyl-S-(2-succino)cysteine monooxygenase
MHEDMGHMSGSGARMKLGAFLPRSSGHHAASWRHPGAQADRVLDFALYQGLAQTAERAKLDMIFLADGLAVRRDYELDAQRRSGQQTVHFEPLTLLSALSVVTKHIGLVATASTTYNEPYHIARKFASLDHLSGGRAGWNVVTSETETEAANFNDQHHVAHAQRYERAREFLQVTTGLWDSWADDAFVFDKESGVYFDDKKIHVLDHRGTHFSVNGPLNIARPPQGYPVIVQAGASEDGQEFAAATADVVFTAQQTLTQAQTFYRGLKRKLAKYGRSPGDLKIMPGVLPIAARTSESAKEKYDLLQRLIHPKVGLALLSELVGGVDLSSYPLDGPLPDLPQTNGNQSRLKLMRDMADRETLTIRKLYMAIAGARGHWTIVGTPEEIADQLEDWFVHEAADGFNIMPAYVPGGLDDFVDMVVPVLRQRALFRTGYEGTTLREHLGLPRPVNQFAASESPAGES